ncbi:EKC/KEOPS complex subunit LAGE3-like isoform X2 [Equus asinus]|uniref:L antigen family member 3 n=1 Tax=Equus asinus TaxID=9793 RepID=A0A9L0JPM6_EQUAS|nr:EKC/KEOPS complex subunit LAGE3-like isoform X1 [Equus asinus]
MQAADGDDDNDGAGGAVGGSEDLSSQHSPRAPDCQDSSGCLEGQGGSEGAVDETAIALLRGEQALHIPGPGGDAATVAVGPGSRLLEFTLTVPFRSPLEAEMARRAMAPEAQRHQQAVQKECAVNGSVLAVRWTAEDPGLLQISINSFLDQLALVVGSIQHFGLPPPLSLG